MSEIHLIQIDTIDVNPFRLTSTYPYVERKLAALMQSYEDVGMWEGVIGRRAGNRTECAFGHHRIEAARRRGMTMVPMIIRDLSDEQMLQFMGRENLEDYNADFLCMLETWEAAVKFRGASRKSIQPLEIARLLGWTRADATGAAGDRLNDTASACHAAHALITGGHLGRTDLTDVSVSAAGELVSRAQVRMETIEKMGRTTQRPREEIDRAKSHVGAAVKETAAQYRRGEVSRNQLRSQVDVNAYRGARKDPRPSPLFEVFGKGLADSIARMLHNDSASERLEEVRKAIGMVTLDDDKRIVARLQFELAELGERTSIWQKRITLTDKKVTRLRIDRKED